MKHRNDVFVRAFLDGVSVQFRPIGASHHPWLGVGALRMFDEEGFEFRIEPPKNWFRAALIRTQTHVRLVGTGYLFSEKEVEAMPVFIRWLTDRIEYTERE